jgi:hypothetical protein
MKLRPRRLLRRLLCHALVSQLCNTEHNSGFLHGLELLIYLYVPILYMRSTINLINCHFLDQKQRSQKVAGLGIEYN